jgi:hypothetical protein
LTSFAAATESCDWTNMNIIGAWRLMKLKIFLQYGILLLGISISVILVISFPNFYHYDDVRTFLGWSKFWNEGWEDIYRNCIDCNYPILGMFSSAGVLSLLARVSSQNAVWVFRIILALVDGLNVLLFFFLLKEFSIKNAALWAGITGLLLSSWAGAALWGQIDNVSQLFLLATLFWMVKWNLSGRSTPIIFLVISSLLLAFLLLTKQLIVFSFFPLELLLLVNIFSFRKWGSAIVYLGLHFAFLFFFIFLWDHFLHLEEPYISHLQLIWGGRSGQSNILSINGFNIWVFLHRAMGSSSHVPFIFLSKFALLKMFTPYNTGVFLFTGLAILLSVSTLLRMRKRIADGKSFLSKEDLLNFILLLSIINLGFNVLLTGTHERYLYHFYPFLLLAYMGLRHHSRLFTKTLLVAILIGSSLYGLFVLGILSGVLDEYISIGYQVQKFLAVYHVALLCVLFVIFFAYQGFLQNTKSFLKGIKNGEMLLG